jgi:ABC-2 type transport system ATP-binding protein
MELQHIEVLFDKQVNLEEISKYSNISEASFAGNRVRVYTANPSAVIEFLVDFAKRKGIRILSLNTMMPSLEDVFIKLIKEKEASPV